MLDLSNPAVTLHYFRGRPSPRFIASTMVMFTASALFLLVVAAFLRGPWLDELWSLWMTRPDLGISEAARQRWFRDVHPPLFYFITWLAGPFIGPGLVAHRLLNLLPVAYALGSFIYLARSTPAMRPVLLVFGVLILSSPSALYFAEFRSYTFTNCFAATLTMLLYRVVIAEHDLDPRRDRALATLLAVTLAVALNLHYISSLICATSVGLVALDQLRSGRKRWAALLLGLAALSMLPLIAAFAAERPYMRETLGNFWIKTGSVEAVRVMVSATRPVIANIGVLFCLGAVLMGRSRSADSTPTEPTTDQWRFAALMLGALAISCAVLLVANYFKPLVVGRYLIALTPLLAGALAALTAATMFSRTWLYALFLLNAAVNIAPAAVKEMREAQWYEGGRLVAQQVEACPQTIVYGLNRTDLPPGRPFDDAPNEVEIRLWGMEYVGRSLGFAPNLVRAIPGAVRPHSPRPCPTLVWVEHVYDHLDGTVVAEAAGLTLSDEELKKVHATKTKTGLIVVVPPLGGQ